MIPDRQCTSAKQSATWQRERHRRTAGVYRHARPGDLITKSSAAKRHRHTLSGRRDCTERACYRIGVFVHVKRVGKRPTGRPSDLVCLGENWRSDISLTASIFGRDGIVSSQQGSTHVGIVLLVTIEFVIIDQERGHARQGREIIRYSSYDAVDPDIDIL